MANRQHYSIQLVDQDGKVIVPAGGVCYVALAGDTAVETLTDKDGTSISNPVALTRGNIDFHVDADTVDVDLYIMAPGGQFVVRKDVKMSGPNEIVVDTNNPYQLARIPFSAGDLTAATETDTGFDLPDDAMVLPDGMGIHVIVVDATEDIDVGLLSSEAGGDADGFMDAVSLAALGPIFAEVGFTVGASAAYMDLTGGDVEFTYGVFMAGAGTKAAIAEGSNADTDEGFHLLTPYRIDGTAVSVVVTVSAGSDTGDGFILIPYVLAPTV